ncbi:hypothetical protein D3C74_398440 [compost metagenome]
MIDKQLGEVAGAEIAYALGNILNLSVRLGQEQFLGLQHTDASDIFDEGDALFFME